MAWSGACVRGVHRRVRICAVREQQASQVDPSGVDRFEQRAARRERLLFELTQLHPLVRVETHVEQSTQHVRTIAPHSRLQHRLSLQRVGCT
jgi:hypothetical protein